MFVKHNNKDIYKCMYILFLKTSNAQQNHRANTGTDRMSRLIQVNSFSRKYIIRANIKMSMKRYVTLKGMQQSLVCV